MNKNEKLSNSSILKHKKPKKLIFMLHGYGDSAENFINLANALDQSDWKANYIALNAPTLIPNYSTGRQWFNLYPNGKYLSEAGSKEIKIILSEISTSIKLIENSINEKIFFYGLSSKDCILIGFSQGAMMTFEFGKYSKKKLCCLAIIAGRIISENKINNNTLLKTPIFISHGGKDEIISKSFFDLACRYMKNNQLIYESHLLERDTHTISYEALLLLQNFIKKNCNL